MGDYFGEFPSAQYGPARLVPRSIGLSPVAGMDGHAVV